MVKVACVCGGRFDAKAKLAGKRVKCPKCGQSIDIPKAQAASPSGERIRITCPCGGSFGAKASLAGKRFKCPKCGNPITVPANQPSPVATQPATTSPPASPIIVVCSCGKMFAAEPRLAGTTVHCPGCSSPLVVPQPAIVTQRQPVPMQPVPTQPLQLPQNMDPLGGNAPLLGGGAPLMQPGALPMPSSLPPSGAMPGLRPAAAGRPIKKRVGKKKKKRKKQSDDKTKTIVGGIIGGVVVLLGLVGFAVTPLGGLFGMGLMVVAGCIGFIGGLLVLVKAFEEDAICGILILLVPFYGLFYLVTRWEDTLPFHLVLVGFGGQMMAIVYMFIFSAVHGAAIG